MGWLSVWGPSIAAVIVAAAFTWLFGYVTERQHRRGVRELVSWEVAHNVGVASTLQGDLEGVAEVPDKRFALQLLVAVGKTPHWERSRWDLPDVGVAFSPPELARVAMWYFDLQALAYDYEFQLSKLRNTDLMHTTEQQMEAQVRQLQEIARKAIMLCDNCPDFAPKPPE